MKSKILVGVFLMILLGGLASATYNPLLKTDGENVGIGTDNPSATLEISSISTNVTEPQLRIYNPNNGTGNSSGIRLKTASGWDVELQTVQKINWLQLTDKTGNIQHSWSSNKYYPGASSEGGTKTGYITGDGTNIGIGTSSPSVKLDVNGSIKIGGGSPGVDKVLRSDANGLASWSPLSSLGVTSVSNSDGSLTIPSTTGAVVASLNAGHANTWTGAQTYNSRPAFNGGTSGSTAPFTVDSNYKVTNLNADLLDGQQGSYYMPASTDNWVNTNGDTMTGSLHLNNADSIYFEGDMHSITYNDGQGNFNIRIGHVSNSSGVEEVREAGYVSHMEWSQTIGWWQVNMDSTNHVVGDIANWDHTLQFTKDGLLTVDGKTVWNSGNDGLSSGLDADLLDGHDSATASTINTIALRDGSGDINARLFRSEYDTTNSNIGYIMTQVDTASNNYMRPSTPAQVKTALGLDSAITGSGTTNYIPKFTASGTIGSSVIYQNGTNVGIGTTSPGEKLDVQGNISLTGCVKFSNGAQWCGA